MHKRTFLISGLAAAAGLALASTAIAAPGEPIPGLVVKGGKNPGGNANKVVIELNLTKPETWAYDLAGGTLLPAEAEPAAKGEQVGPVIGVGVVVKKNPGSGASKITANPTGGLDLPEKLENGLYDLVITIPAAAMPAKSKRAPNGVKLSFYLVKVDEGIFNLSVPKTEKGAGSPKADGF